MKKRIIVSTDTGLKHTGIFTAYAEDDQLFLDRSFGYTYADERDSVNDIFSDASITNIQRPANANSVTVKRAKRKHDIDRILVHVAEDLGLSYDSFSSFRNEWSEVCKARLINDLYHKSVGYVMKQHLDVQSPDPEVTLKLLYILSVYFTKNRGRIPGENADEEEQKEGKEDGNPIISTSAGKVPHLVKYEQIKESPGAKLDTNRKENIKVYAAIIGNFEGYIAHCFKKEVSLKGLKKAVFQFRRNYKLASSRGYCPVLSAQGKQEVKGYKSDLYGQLAAVFDYNINTTITKTEGGEATHPSPEEVIALINDFIKGDQSFNKSNFNKHWRDKGYKVRRNDSEFELKSGSKPAILSFVELFDGVLINAEVWKEVPVLGSQLFSEAHQLLTQLSEIYSNAQAFIPIKQAKFKQEATVLIEQWSTSNRWDYSISEAFLEKLYDRISKFCGQRAAYSSSFYKSFFEDKMYLSSDHGPRSYEAARYIIDQAQTLSDQIPYLNSIDCNSTLIRSRVNHTISLFNKVLGQAQDQGLPLEIVLESSRSFMRGADIKTFQDKQKAENEQDYFLYQLYCKEDFNKKRPTDYATYRINKRRYKAYLLTNGIDLYTNKPIGKNIFSSQFDVDHVYPQSFRRYDADWNLVLTSMDENGKKSNKTIKHWKTEGEYQQILKRFKSLLEKSPLVKRYQETYKNTKVKVLEEQYTDVWQQSTKKYAFKKGKPIEVAYMDWFFSNCYKAISSTDDKQNIDLPKHIKAFGEPELQQNQTIVRHLTAQVRKCRHFENGTNLKIIRASFINEVKGMLGENPNDKIKKEQDRVKKRNLVVEALSRSLPEEGALAALMETTLSHQKKRVNLKNHALDAFFAIVASLKLASYQEYAKEYKDKKPDFNAFRKNWKQQIEPVLVQNFGTLDDDDSIYDQLCNILDHHIAVFHKFGGYLSDVGDLTVKSLVGVGKLTGADVGKLKKHRLIDFSATEIKARRAMISAGKLEEEQKDCALTKAIQQGVLTFNKEVPLGLSFIDYHAAALPKPYQDLPLAYPKARKNLRVDLTNTTEHRKNLILTELLGSDYTFKQFKGEFTQFLDRTETFTDTRYFMDAEAIQPTAPVFKDQSVIPSFLTFKGNEGETLCYHKIKDEKEERIEQVTLDNRLLISNYDNRFPVILDAGEKKDKCYIELSAFEKLSPESKQGHCCDNPNLRLCLTGNITNENKSQTQEILQELFPNYIIHLVENGNRYDLKMLMGTVKGYDSKWNPIFDRAFKPTYTKGDFFLPDGQEELFFSNNSYYLASLDKQKKIFLANTFAGNFYEQTPKGFKETSDYTSRVKALKSQDAPIDGFGFQASSGLLKEISNKESSWLSIPYNTYCIKFNILVKNRLEALVQDIVISD
ncbi:HNH endonuclease domain-containing protein [Persicobacter psychrovividus]|uniref:HNH endonuclease domain-containing protein n=1 Tax=Persicobacter psychrovividus TaxID=387638 RepID=UPI0030CA1E05